jgi:tetratricopeptide (TPR) repeat protein
MTMRLKISVFCAVSILWLAVCHCPYAAAQSFKDANQLYKDSKYGQAIEAYEKISRSGFESGHLYYNLGNSYFKKGELGRALLNYERAKLFIPHDSDLRSNYDFVTGALNVPERYSSEKWFFRWLDRFFDGIGMNGLTILASVLWIVTLLLLAVRLFIPAIKQYAAGGVIVLSALLIVCVVALARKIDYYQHGAIVTSAEVEVKFEPSSGATTYFKLAEGNSVDIIDRSAGWIKIRRPDSKIGWVPASSISSIK